MSKLLVLAGSPKGGQSVTMQYVEYLRRRLPGWETEVEQVGSRINKLESDPAEFADLIDKISAADALLWAMPVYVLLVPYGIKRFIELAFERDALAAFQGKPVATLTTSVRFMDQTAHAYLRAICDDLGLRFCGAYSADMYDLVHRAERKRLDQFSAGLIEAFERKADPGRAYAAIEYKPLRYKPKPATSQLDQGNRRVVVLHDARPQDANLRNMLERFKAAFSGPTEEIDLNAVDMKGPCLGCMRCTWDNRCAYAGRDGYAALFATLQAADMLVFAGATRDRYLSARWKMFFDRSFWNTHKPAFDAKQIGWIVSGPLTQLATLREVINAWTTLQQANPAGVVSDEAANSGELDLRLDALAADMLRGAQQGYVAPTSFYGVAGWKLFRDETYGRLRFLFRSDHNFYKQHGYYDFPQRKLRQRAFNTAMLTMLRLPAFRKKFYAGIKSGMLRPLQSALRQSGGQGA